MPPEDNNAIGVAGVDEAVGEGVGVAELVKVADGLGLVVGVGLLVA